MNVSTSLQQQSELVTPTNTAGLSNTTSVVVIVVSIVSVVLLVEANLFSGVVRISVIRLLGCCQLLWASRTVLVLLSSRSEAEWLSELIKLWLVNLEV